jgi:hypothetical protein
VLLLAGGNRKSKHRLNSRCRMDQGRPLPTEKDAQTENTSSDER